MTSPNGAQPTPATSPTRTANEIGFDYLRDQLALDRRRAGAPSVRRRGYRRGGFRADRRSAHPAGDRGRRRRAPATWPARADHAVRRLMPSDRSIDEDGRNVALTPSGLAAVERDLGCELYARSTPRHDGRRPRGAARAHLLRRDIDYVVRRRGAIGRRIQGPHRPRPALAGRLQTALEWKEGVTRKVRDGCSARSRSRTWSRSIRRCAA